MKQVIFFCVSMFLTGIIYSQVNSLNDTRETNKSSLNSTNPLKNSNSKPIVRIKHKEKIKQLPRKENYEVSPKKD